MTDWIHKFLIRTTPKQRGCCGASYARGWIHASWLISALWLAVIWVIVGVIGGGEQEPQPDSVHFCVGFAGEKCVQSGCSNILPLISGRSRMIEGIGGNTVITYDTEIRDDDDVWEPSQKQFRFTVPTSGLWRTTSDRGWELVEARETAQP